MICRVSWSYSGHRLSTTVEAPSTIDALLAVMQQLNLSNASVKVLVE